MCIRDRPVQAPSAGVALEEAEMGFNVLQWCSTIVVDCRPDDVHVSRLTESIVCPGLHQVAALPFKDDALCIHTPDAIRSVLQKRLFNSLFVVSDKALADLHVQHPWLFEPEAPRSMPNMISDDVLLGHQGHAQALHEYQSVLTVAGVINLAGDKVPCYVEALPEDLRGQYVDVRHPDGRPLTDGAGDGGRFTDVLDSVLQTIERACVHGRVLVHCQQGRSRSAAVVCAWLLKKHASWCLLDALKFVALRRPEIQVLSLIHI
eukprot:TRINITY_DN36608_c0_g1_i1.p1 TRINITY_DN36608_c0_g1~~TRINITY_DN36608_c0_g1_i1.p1  ORF type:complete len:262 (+),score=67.73 TRINITY_DN36608_c0_g1_i1:71-856(+)